MTRTLHVKSGYYKTFSITRCGSRLCVDLCIGSEMENRETSFDLSGSSESTIYRAVCICDAVMIKLKLFRHFTMVVQEPIVQHP